MVKGKGGPKSKKKDDYQPVSQELELPVSKGGVKAGNGSLPTHSNSRGDLVDSSAASPPAAAAGGHGVHGNEKSGFVKTLGNIFISFVGAGMLGLPYAFKRSGLVMGSLALISVASLALHCMLMLAKTRKTLVESKASADAHTYSDVAAAAMGPVGRRIVDTLLVTSQTGFCVAYFIFISQNMSTMTGTSEMFWIVLCIPLQIGLAFMRSLTALAPFSLIADFANVYGMLLVLRDDFGNFRVHAETVNFTSVRNIPFLFGVAIYCFEGIGMILPIESSMEDAGDFQFVLTLGITSITFIFIVFGAVGYLAFGPDTADIITLNLPQDWTTATIKIALCLALFFTVPIMQYPVYEVLERTALANERFLRNVGPSSRWPVFKLIRSSVIVVIAVVAASVPSFGVFISLIGSLCCSSLAFILPASLHFLVHYETSTRLMKVKDVSIVVFGLIAACLGTSDAIVSLLAGESHHHK